MDLKELTAAMHHFVTTQGWYEPGSARPQTLRNLAISLILEASEVLEHFQWQDAPGDKEELGSELADVMLYLMQLASLAEIDLEQVVLQKLEKNYKRTWDVPQQMDVAGLVGEESSAAAAAAPAPEAEAGTPRPAGILEESRPWPFTRSELTSGLRRYSGNASLTIETLEEINIPYQRPARGRVRGLRVLCDSTSGKQTFELAIKEPQGTTRAGTVSAGWREASLYTQLGDQIPLRMPELVATGPGGAWLAFKMLKQGRSPEQWQPGDYGLAIDQLTLLHDRFWGQAEYLSTFPWLARPFTSDLEIYQHVASTGLQRIKNATQTLYHQDPSLIPLFELIVSQMGSIAQALHQAPATLLHGDYWPGNLVLYPDRRLFVLDWQRAGIGSGMLDLFGLIQSSLWWFETLPVEPAQIVQRYREGLEVASGQRWTDEEWLRLWDYALLWTFLSDWLDLLATIPNPILKTRWDQLEKQWFEPLRQAAHRWLVR